MSAGAVRGFEWRRTSDPDLVAATWVRDNSYHYQPLSLEEAAMWARAEWFSPGLPEEVQTLGELRDEISLLRARGEALRAEALGLKADSAGLAVEGDVADLFEQFLAEGDDDK